MTDQKTDTRCPVHDCLHPDEQCTCDRKTDSVAITAADRVQKFVDRWAKSELIYGLDTGSEHDAELTVSDLRELLAATAASRAFVEEWRDRFGFLATENDPRSFESIDEVACLLTKQQSASRAEMEKSRKVSNYLFQVVRQQDAELSASREREQRLRKYVHHVGVNGEHYSAACRSYQGQACDCGLAALIEGDAK